MDAAELLDDSASRIKVIVLHAADNCDDRQLTSSANGDQRDIIFGGLRNNACMKHDQKALRAWLAGEMAKHGRGVGKELAAHLGLSPNQISRMSNTNPAKEVRDIKGHELQMLVQFFGSAPPGFVPDAVDGDVMPRDGHMTRAVVVGTVEAGTWRSVDQLDQREMEEIAVEADDEFPDARILLFDISGDSMNAYPRAPILPGMIAVCLQYEDIERRYPLRDNIVVVIERTRDGGHERELSIKEMRIFDDRMEFHPRSTNPRHKPITVKVDMEADDGTQVRIVALLRRITTRTIRF